MDTPPDHRKTEETTSGRGQTCPYTGLPRFSRPEWTDVSFEDDYRTTITVIGDHILMTQPSGHAARRAVEKALRMTREAADHISRKGPYVHIEDYTLLKAATLDSRQSFIHDMRKRKGLLGLVFCNLSQLNKISVKLARRLNIVDYEVRIADNRAEALEIALEILIRKNPEDRVLKRALDRLRDLGSRGDAEPGQAWTSLDETALSELETFKYFEEILYYIENIDWETPGFDFEKQVDPENPFRTLLDAMGMIKKDLDELFETRKQAEEKYRLLVDNADHSIFIIQDHAIKFCNPHMLKKLGYTREELLHAPIEDFIHPDDRALFQEYYAKRITGQDIPGTLTSRMITGSQKELWIQISSVRVQWEGSAATLNFASDITDKKKLESQLLQSQKMEAIGTLAGGIAHDFNNILSAIIGYSELALLDAPKRKKLDVKIKEILKAGYRARDLVNQILLFSRQSEQKMEPMRISPIVNETLKLMRASLPSTIEIRQNILKNEGPVLADPTQIHQVLMNLCTNAGHAMDKGGGILEVNLDRVELDARLTVRNGEIHPGTYIKLTVSDTGSGMPPEIIKRAFDPFFSTKETGEGTGLGLSVVHGIIRSHDGGIDVKSEEGSGTTFEIYFPVIQEMDEEDAGRRDEASLPTGKREHILFVDDEKALARLTKKMLKQLGYRVTSKTSSPGAWELFRKKPSKFDLVICDITMPQITGKYLARKMLALRPDIPVILCTGDNRQISEKWGETIGIRRYISKPFSKKDLAVIVRSVLDGEQG